MPTFVRTSLFLSTLSLVALTGCAADVPTEPGAATGDELSLPGKCLFCGPPPPWLFAPTSDARFEIGLCVHTFSAETEASLVDSLRTQFTAQFGPVDVEATCTADGTKERIGVWTTTGDASARISELATEATMLQTGENFATYFTASLVQNAVNRAWAAQPKTINGPDSNSIWWFANDVHLNGIDPVRLLAPNQVVTTVHGVADVFIAGVKDPLSVTSTTTDAVGVSDGLPSCTTSTYQQVAWPGSDSTSTGKGGGAGCPFIRSLPTSIPVPKGNKMVVTYSRAAVEASAGITSGALIGLLAVPRSPSAVTHGPGVVVFDQGDTTAVGTFSVDVTDMRAPVTVAWTGGTTTSTGTTATMTLAAPSGAVGTRTVTATVTDVDGLRATASASVQLQRDPCSTGNSHIPNCN